MNLTTRLLTKFSGQFVGQDVYGNKYYQDKRIRDNGKHRRWVVYQGDVEASKVPSQWHAWLHYVVDVPPTEKMASYSWEKSHQRNLTGTKFAHKPCSWIQESAVVTQSDYEAWKPE